MKSKLLALRPVDQNETGFLDSLRSDRLIAGAAHGFANLVSSSRPLSQQDVGPLPQNAPVSLTISGSTYGQNFDALSNTVGSTTNNLNNDPQPLPGWFMDEAGGGARDNDQYAVDAGGSTTGDTFSYGVVGETDRALGELRSGTLFPNFGAAFTNNTGATVTELLISYVGEQWRFGGVHSTVADKLDFQISFDATSLTTGTWINVDQLDFNAPITTGLARSLVGNDAANRTALSFNITSLTIANGATFWIRWVDVDATGADDGLAVDDFFLTPSAAPPAGETQTVQFNPVSVTQNEGNSGTTAYTFTVTRTGGTTGQLDFSGTIAAGSTDGTDFVGGTVPTVFSGSIPAGQASATVTVNVQGDVTIEADESFTLTLTTASNTDGTVTTNIGANDDATGTITNDDTPVISIANAQDTEVDPPNTKDMVFIVTLSQAPTSGFVTVNFTTVNGTALATTTGFDNDYVTTTGQVVFGVGETMKEIRVPVRGDLDDEPDEFFSIVLSNPVGGVIGTGTATGTIIDNDVTQAVSIADAAIVEGDNGVTYLSFTVSLTLPAAGTTTVDFATADGSAVAGQDYLALSGQLSFAAGETSKTILVPVIGDDISEANETLTVTLSNPVGTAIGDGSATGTITNDDGPQYFSLASGTFEEHWTDTSRIAFNDNWSDVPYIIGYLGDIDAASPTNVDPRTLTGPALGAVDVIANLSATTSTSGGVGEFELADPTIGLQGSGTADAPSIVLYMDATGRADIRLQASLRDIDTTSDNAAQQVNVQYRTDPNGSWTNVPGGNFSDVTTGGSATQVTALDVILPPGANNASTLEIRIMTVNAAGNDEWVGIDDIIVSSQVSQPSLSIANAAVFEGDAGTTPITFTVTRNGSSAGPVTANYTVNFGSGPFDANAADFVAGQLFTGQVSFADGETSQTITLNVQGDLNPEGDDNFTVTLSNVSGGTIADGTATGTIVNDDGPPPLVTINDVTVVEGDAGTVLMTFTVTRTGGTDAFSVDWQTADGSATAGSDYIAASGTVNFAAGQMSDTVTVSVTVNGDTESELSETLQVLLSNATNNALITDGIGIGTIASDDPIFIHDIQGTSYFSPILAAEGIHSFNVASSATVIVRAVVTAVDNVGQRQGYYLTEEFTDWDGNTYTSEGIFVMTRNDAGVGNVVSGVTVGDLVQVSANVMEYQAFSSMPRTVLVNPTGLSVISQGNSLTQLTLTLTNMPNEVLTGVTPDYFDSSDGAGDTFDASVYALSYFEAVEGMLVTIPDMVVADGFVSTSGGRPILQAYSLDSANPDQINSRGGYTIAGDPPIGPPDTPETGDDTNHGGRHLHDGDVNPDVIELDFTDFATAPPADLLQNATMGDLLGDVTGIIDFDFTDRKLFVTGMEPGGFVNGGIPERETTALGADPRSLTVATFNVENLDALDNPAKFTGLADAIANNLKSPDIICIEEIQDNNGPGAGSRDASLTWQMLVDAVNAATGKHYQWVDEEPNGSEGGEPGGNIRVGFLYNTDRVQLGDLDANATLAERRAYTDRIGDGVRDAGDLIAFSDNMVGGGEINPSDWAGTRRSLLGEFTFNGNTVYVTANHLPAKGGSGEFWQVNQNLETGDPDNSGWAQRNQVAQDIYAVLNLIESSGTGAGIVAGGDFNDFYFYRPLTTVTGYTLADGAARVGGTRFDNLTLTLPEAERYTYTFDGRSQAIDHVIANGLLSNVATYDVVHINTGYNAQGTGPDASPRLSDHDPGVASFDYRDFAETLLGTGAADIISGFGGNDTILAGGGDDLLSGDAGNDLIDGEAGIDTAVYLDPDLMFTDTVLGWVITSTEGNDFLQRTEIVIDGTGQRNLLVGATAFAGLQAALDEAVADDNVRLAAGSYSGTFNYDVTGL
ncbi:MAG TPA: Calx-beta domain-containing protein, partial [Allosphingosinicella sp.]|nr:Calx-beta domain-containing protein [Allosphingosinicella sp.]